MAAITVRQSVPVFNDTPVQSYDMLVEVTTATDMPEEIFVFQQGLAPARLPTEEASDFFVNVASPTDLEEVPVTTPQTNGMNPYYRVSNITLRFRSLVELEETWSYIKEDIQGLVSALNTGVIGGSTEDVTFQ